MAAKIIFVFFLLLRSSLSLSVSLDVKTVQLIDSVPENGLTKPVFNSETVLRPEEDNKLVQSLSTEILLKAFDSFEAAHGKRIKRYTIKNKVLCPKDKIEYRGYCLTEKQYEKYKDDLEGSDDYVAES